MFITMLFALGRQDAAAPSVPTTLNSIYVTSVSGGACTGPTRTSDASIRVSWTSSNFDPALHSYWVYENGIFKVAQITPNNYLRGIAAVRDGPYSPFTSDWVYRVDVVRVADGQVLSTISSDPWIATYGSCSSARGGVTPT